MVKDGFDSKKRWGNSALKGHGVNSPAMTQARSSHEKALSKFKENKKHGRMKVYPIHKGETKEE